MAAGSAAWCRRRRCGCGLLLLLLPLLLLEEMVIVAYFVGIYVILIMRCNGPWGSGGSSGSSQGGHEDPSFVFGLIVLLRDCLSKKGVCQIIPK